MDKLIRAGNYTSRNQSHPKDTYLDWEPPAWHLTKSSDPGTNSESSFATELYGHKAEWLIARRYEGKLGTTEDEGWEGCEFRLRENPPWVALHHLCKLQRCELPVQVDHRSHTNKLDIGTLVKQRRKNIGNLLDGLAKDE